MNIGTAKITPQEMNGIPHHFIDIIDPKERFDLSKFQKLATLKIKEIHSRGALPILCGGTGLYISSITENYSLPAAPPDLKRRTELEKNAEEKGNSFVHDILKNLNPTIAEQINPANLRYVIRAIEIEEKKQNSSQDISPSKSNPEFSIFNIYVNPPREILYQRINDRVDKMMDMGLLNEVKTLLAEGYSKDLPSMSSVGYAELIDYIEGKIDLKSAVEKIKQHTRNYAKRQETWFKKYRHDLVVS